MQQQLGFVNHLRMCLKTEEIQGELRQNRQLQELPRINV